jgi:hypothetical protein
MVLQDANSVVLQYLCTLCRVCSAELDQDTGHGTEAPMTAATSGKLFLQISCMPHSLPHMALYSMLPSPCQSSAALLAACCCYAHPCAWPEKPAKRQRCIYNCCMSLANGSCMLKCLHLYTGLHVGQTSLRRASYDLLWQRAILLEMHTDAVDHHIFVPAACGRYLQTSPDPRQPGNRRASALRMHINSPSAILPPCYVEAGVSCVNLLRAWGRECRPAVVAVQPPQYHQCRLPHQLTIPASSLCQTRYDAKQCLQYRTVTAIMPTAATESQAKRIQNLA